MFWYLNKSRKCYIVYINRMFLTFRNGKSGIRNDSYYINEGGWWRLIMAREVQFGSWGSTTLADKLFFQESRKTWPTRFLQDFFFVIQIVKCFHVMVKFPPCFLGMFVQNSLCHVFNKYPILYIMDLNLFW